MDLRSNPFFMSYPAGNTTNPALAAAAGSGTPQLNHSFVVTVTVTVPAQSAAAAVVTSRELPKPPFPVVLLINGFQVRSLVRHLAKAQMASKHMLLCE
jgi:hypothetical protein